MHYNVCDMSVAADRTTDLGKGEARLVGYISFMN